MVVSIEQSPGGLMSVVVFWVFLGVCVWGGGVGGVTHLAPQLIYLLFTKASSEWSRWKGVYQIAILKEVFNKKSLRYAKLHKSTYFIGDVLTSSESALQHYLNTVEKGEF